ncbi:helix-turn-helix domain-containing protein [Paenibacillus sp. Marseille-Q4541]|uniref:helix-turn-helix domain-containing protein n=1 Tax=Paenibacillus sp. Marseille-Q4541 TaxID=2831522 RepID=UPI002018B85E|nr:helix-turn-helix domain-containing protein [Paenibacillus sp. Marseille-Q4541]
MMTKIEDSADLHIGELIKELMKKRSLTMRKLSEMSGMDIATISRIVSGKQEPKLSHLKLFSNHLEISIEELVGSSDHNKSNDKNDNHLAYDQSIENILETLGTSQFYDTNFTNSDIEMELSKYEQYAQTEEGDRLIKHDFNNKINQINAIGPFIQQLKKLYTRYCDDKTSITDRFLIGSALLYFILSADVIPDYVFPIGYLDDAIAVQLVLSRLKKLGEKSL